MSFGAFAYIVQYACVSPRNKVKHKLLNTYHLTKLSNDVVSCITLPTKVLTTTHHSATHPKSFIVRPPGAADPSHCMIATSSAKPRRINSARDVFVRYSVGNWRSIRNVSTYVMICSKSRSDAGGDGLADNISIRSDAETSPKVLVARRMTANIAPIAEEKGKP